MPNEDWNIAVQPSSLSDGVLQRYQQIENDALGWSVTLVDFASDQRGDLTDLAAVLHRVDAWREGESDANLVMVLLQTSGGEPRRPSLHPLMLAAGRRSQAASNTRLTITASGFGCP